MDTDCTGSCFTFPLQPMCAAARATDNVWTTPAARLFWTPSCWLSTCTTAVANSSWTHAVWYLYNAHPRPCTPRTPQRACHCVRACVRRCSVAGGPSSAFVRPCRRAPSVSLFVGQHTILLARFAPSRRSRACNCDTPACYQATADCNTPVKAAAVVRCGVGP